MRSNGSNISGVRFGRITAIIVDPCRISGSGKPVRWICWCDCGKIKSVAGTKLRDGNVQSCGCYAADMSRSKNRTHGRSNSAEYRAWRGMRERCTYQTYKAYSRYGGRGITVCARWDSSFQSFLLDMGCRPSPRHSLDRKDNDGNYEPSNCKWSTPEEQGRNRSDNRWIDIDGEIKILTDWSAISGNSKTTITQRLASGWHPRDAVFRRRLVV